MLNEFYKYIADNIVSFFQSKADTLRPGERFCLRLDTEEMVSGVDEALRARTALDKIQGSYRYGTVYETFTIKLSQNVEVVVASKINSMTDDFLATLRNAELTEYHFPILMITHSPIDTITSGTGDLASNGMPFHAASIVSKMKDEIKTAQLSPADRILLDLELERKQSDRFSDKSSLFEYSDLLTVLERGFVVPSDFSSFSLLADDMLSSYSEDKIRGRLLENHQIFDQIDRVFRHGNIADALDKEYDPTFVQHLLDAKKKGSPWYEDYTFDMVKSSRDKLRRKLDNPLNIDDEDLDAFSESALEYCFPPDTLMFVRCDGETRAKQRRKNIIIFNPEQRDNVSIRIRSNIAIKQSWVECIGATAAFASKELTLTMTANGCSFSRASIKDPNNNITYLIKICVLNLEPSFLEELQTCYCLDTPKNLARASIQAIGLGQELIINPRKEEKISDSLRPNIIYSCNYNQTLALTLNDEMMDTDTGSVSFQVKCGAITIPLQIKDEPVKPTELTGISAFKKKYSEKHSFEYRDGKVISGTTEYYTKPPFRENLALENAIVQNNWLAVNSTANGLEECQLDVPDSVRLAYFNLLNELKSRRTLPSLMHYSGKAKRFAEEYVTAVEEALEQIPAGHTLTSQENDLLLIGAVIKLHDEHTISLCPLHPLNVLYQLMLDQETEVGSIRDNLVEKLSSLYLLPYIKDSDKSLYHAIEQRHSPEWHIYAQVSNKRFQGARNFVQKLISEKISQYLSTTSPRTYNVSSDWRLICLMMDSNLRRLPWMSDNT